MVKVRNGLAVLVVWGDNGGQDKTESNLVMPLPPGSLLPNLGLPTQQVDGNDVEAVADAARAALGACRRGDGPQAVVADNYLRDFHSQRRDIGPGQEQPAAAAQGWA